MSNFLFAQDDIVLEWAKSIGGSRQEESRDFITDLEGNVYVTSLYLGTIDVDPSDEEVDFTALGTSTDLFIVKLNASGEYQWGYSFGDEDLQDISSDVAIDSEGNVIIGGGFDGTVDFDPSEAGVSELTSEGDDLDAFLLKLSPDGEFMWVKYFGGIGINFIRELSLDESGNIYTTGTLNATADLDPGVDVFELSSFDLDPDVFVQKLNSDGEFLWAKRLGELDDDRPESIHLDASGNVIISGRFEGNFDANPSGGGEIFTGAGSRDGFVVKLDTDGEYLWSQQIGGTSLDLVFETATDSDENVYVGGLFSTTVDFDQSAVIENKTAVGSRDIFIEKLTPDGDLIWVKTIGGSGYDGAYGLTISDGLYFTGSVSAGEVIDFDPGLGVFNMTGVGIESAYIEKLDLDGNFIWAKSFGGEDALCRGQAIQIDTFGNVLVKGEYNVLIDADPGEEEAILDAVGNDDIFIQKFKECSPTFSTQEITSCISYEWINGETYFESTTDEYILTNVAGCDSVITLNLTINEVDITTSTETVTITANETGAIYQWLDCNDGFAIIDDATSESYTPTEDGVYAVEVTIGECVDTSSCITVEGVGIDENLLAGIEIYPNPSERAVNIDLGNLKNAVIRVYGIRGDIIYQTTPINTQIYTFNLEVDPGIYFVQLVSEEFRGYFRLIVE